MKKMHAHLLCFLCVASVISGVLITRAELPTTAPQLVGEGAEALAQADLDFAKMSVTQGAKPAFLAFLADDAIELPDGGAPVIGKGAISVHLARFDEHGTVLDWHPARAEVAGSGDLGYTFGTWELRLKGRGEPLAAGNYATVWKKTPDGLWKVVLDVGNQSKRGPD